jgi:hypothetical protein
VTYAFPVAESVSFMEFVRLLSGDDQVRSDFVVDPDGTLSAFGLEDLSPADVRDAIALVEDNRTVDWSDAYGSGSGGVLAFGSGSGAAPHPDHPVACPTYEAGGDALDRPTHPLDWDDPHFSTRHPGLPHDALDHDDPSTIDDPWHESPDLFFGH